MLINKMAPLQEKLDERIRKEKGIDYDTSNLKIIAFKTEFGEFLNEHRFFKFWSNKPSSSKEVVLEEYVDGIHFLLSIGIERKYIKWAHALEAIDRENRSLESLALDIFNNPINSAGKWIQCVNDYLQLGKLVGISEDNIERAYTEKNKVNHARQDSGY